MGATIGDADLPEQLVEPSALRLAAGDRQRQGNVLLRSQHRQQIEELEDEADVLTPQSCQLVVVHAGDIRTGNGHRAGSWPVEAGEDMHQGRLARARRAHYRGQLTGLDLERDTA